jgi:hypothetical protein
MCPTYEALPINQFDTMITGQVDGWVGEGGSGD